MKRRTTSDTPPMSSATVAVLLHGWHANPPAGQENGHAGFFGLFEARNAGILRAWREHERWLRAQAAAWGWAPNYELADGRRLFFAEFCSLPPAEQSAYGRRMA